MRRTDKELTKKETLKLFETAEYGILSMVDENNLPYAVPMNFVYNNDSLYFHCAKGVGEKLTIMKTNPEVCFTVVNNVKLLPENFSTLYMSGIAYGTIEIVQDQTEKRNGIEAILKKYSPRFLISGLNFINQNIDKIDILKLNINEVTGKGKRS